MTVIETVVYALHLLFAGLWTGSVLFATATLPGIAGSLPASARDSFVGTLRNVSRASAAVLFLSGGYMLTLAGYTESGVLTGTGQGHLVLTMLVLWFALAGLTEVAAGKIEDGEDATSILYGASTVAILLLLDAGALATGGF
ncbi:hypothetical protein [Halobacterium sp. KA-6]|jgi:uncharacterized membrane protein|uniref:hypothetical protein n=1 Tax=Halobacterium sp. KA-6 TaxID=2896368 RepID=UPI001E2E160E|nr:hypothetical protein [Halobacterium sp. KA-6]MCD2202660.1 hypothetical protein [Halobacterium sp. KA-6]